MKWCQKNAATISHAFFWCWILNFTVFPLYPYQNFSSFIYIYIYIHHVVPLARISLTLSHHFFLSFIASGRSSGLHPVFSHSCCMNVVAGCPAFARPYVGFHWGTSLMSSSLLLLQCPAYLVCLTCIVFVMGGKWSYSWCFVGCCRQDLFNITRNILVYIYIYIYIYIYVYIFLLYKKKTFTFLVSL